MANWLTLDELSDYLKLGRTTLYRMAQNGELPASKIGTQWRFDREEIDAWVKEARPGTEGGRTMSQGINTRDDLIVALLYAGEGDPAGRQTSTPVTGITRLEKLLFVLKEDEGFLRSTKPSESLNFVPFRMGPWTSEVYDEIDFLESLGLVSKNKTDVAKPPADAAHDDELFGDLVLDKYQKSGATVAADMEIFQLTEVGRKKAFELWSRLSDDEKRRLVRIKKQFNNMNLQQFLRYVYAKHPEYTTKSEIKDQLFGTVHDA